MSMTSFVHLVTQVEGLHHWPDAQPPERYLRAPHRHLFVVTARVQVFTHDREIEINAATRWMSGVLTSFADPPADADAPPDFGSQSCERLAARLVDALTGRGGRHRRIRCTVAEDGLLGAGVSWDPAPAMGLEPGS
jgi:hypothetical protein